MTHYNSKLLVLRHQTIQFMKRSKQILFWIVLLGLYLQVQQLQAQHFAKLDTLFGLKGRLNIAMTGDWGVADAMVVQPDGKVVLAGWVGNSHYIGILRLLPSGKPDPAFGKDGKVFLPLSVKGTGLSRITLLLQKNGKIWVVGAGYQPDTLPDLRKPFEYQSEYNPDDMFHSIDHAGIGFGSSSGLHTDLLLVRLLADGKVDMSVGQKGLVVHSALYDETISTLLADKKGNMYLCGVTERMDFKNKKVSMRRAFALKMDKNGKSIPSYGDQGLFVSADSSFSYEASACLDAASNVVMMVTTAEPGFKLLFLDKNGQLNPKFGENGVISRKYVKPSQGFPTVFPSSQKGLFVVHSEQWDNRCKSKWDERSKILLEKLNPDGSWDTDFGRKGLVDHDLHESDYIYGAWPSPEGGFYLSGTCFDQNQYNFLAVKVLENGQLDSSFTGKGYASIKNPKMINAGFKIQEAPDGTVYMAGGSLSMFASYAIVKFLPKLRVTFDTPAPTETPDAETNAKKPKKYAESGNTILLYPNPITQKSATIAISVLQFQEIEICLFDVNGKLIKILELVPLAPGDHEIPLNFSGTEATGTYFIRVASDLESKLIQVVLVN